MRRRSLILDLLGHPGVLGVAAAAVLVGITLLALPVFSQSGVTVQLFQFRPSPLEAKAGAKVTFTNEDQIEHTVTSGTPGSPDGRFDLRLNGKGATGTVALQKAGVYPFFCSRHQSMRGEIRVQ
jgi:plastocyanin